MRSQSTKETTQRSAIVFVAVIGALGNVLLAGAKVAVGLSGNSQALVADGVHSLSDLVTDAAVVLGAKFWTAPPDTSHPYGHGRLETLVNLFIGLVLAGTAIGIGWKGVVTIGVSHSVQLGWSAFAVSLGSVAVKEAMFRWTARRGRTIGSSALVANAWHHRSDAMSSLPVLLAVVVGWFAPQLTILDHLAAVLVAALLLKAAWDIMKPAVLELLEARDFDLEKEIHDAAEAQDEVHAVYDVRSRRVGGAVFVDLKMIVDPDMSVVMVHALQHELQSRIRSRHPAVSELQAHVEPGVARARPFLGE
jgi:cation diffusion facilitator family transporter